MVLVEIVGNISGKALSKDNQSPPFQRIKAGIVTGTVNILFSAVVVQRRKKSYAVFLPVFLPIFLSFSTEMMPGIACKPFCSPSAFGQ